MKTYNVIDARETNLPENLLTIERWSENKVRQAMAPMLPSLDYANFDTWQFVADEWLAKPGDTRCVLFTRTGGVDLVRVGV